MRRAWVVRIIFQFSQMTANFERWVLIKYDLVLFHFYRIQEICQGSTASGDLLITVRNY